MADVRVSLDAPVVADPQRQARLICAGITVILPWWPDEVAWNQMAYAWGEQNRPGRAPLLLLEAQTLPEVQIGFILAYRSNRFVEDAASIQPTLDALRKTAVSGQPAQLMLAARDTGRWRVTDFSYTELEWAAEGSPLRAEVSLTLKRAQDAAAPVGPVRRS